MTSDDAASQQEEFARDIALNKRKPELPKIGFCHDCGEVVKIHTTFCDADCRYFYERRTENAKGKV